MRDEPTFKQISNSGYNVIKSRLTVIYDEAKNAKANMRGGNYQQAQANVDAILGKLRLLKSDIG